MSLSKVTIATTFCLLGCLIAKNRANASTLFIGSYGSFVRDINTISFIPQSETAAKFIAQQNQNTLVLDPKQLTKEEVINQIDALASAEPLKEQVEREYTSFEQKSAMSSINNQNANPEKINADIEARYQDLVETDGQKNNLFQSHRLTKRLIQQGNKIGSNHSLQKVVREVNGTSSQQIEDNNLLPEYFKAGIFMLVLAGGGLISLPIILAFGTPDGQGAVSLLGEKFSKPKIPDNVLSLHQKTFKQVRNFARKAERIDDDKFSNKEFTLYIKLRDKVEQGAEEYSKICQSIKYLEVAISAQGSYLKIEQTELRYRSRKQQAFYKFVTDSITDDIDKNEFKNSVKKKLAEIVPLVNSEEGRNALKSYLKEVNIIAQHDLGLKLLALFKKYQLEDFTILRKVAEIVDTVNSQEILNENSLKAIVLGNYDTLEKLAPIIQIEEADIKLETFSKILQYMGLVSRYEKAFNQFKDLMKVLHQWKKPFDSVTLIREQYPKHEYKVPSEFTEKIPGVAVYEKYEKYLAKYK